MPSTTVTVGSSVGIHARPAALIAEAAGQESSTITLALSGGEPVDASSSLLLMTLGAKYGDVLEVAGDDDAAVARISALVEQDLDAREIPA